MVFQMSWSARIYSQHRITKIFSKFLGLLHKFLGLREHFLLILGLREHFFALAADFQRVSLVSAISAADSGFWAVLYHFEVNVCLWLGVNVCGKRKKKRVNSQSTVGQRRSTPVNGRSMPVNSLSTPVNGRPMPMSGRGTGAGRGRGRGRGRSSSPSVGSSSSSQPAVNLDDDIHMSDDDFGVIVNGDFPDLPLLDPAGLWFSDNEVLRVAKEALRGSWSDFCNSWYKANQDQKDKWWNTFRNSVRFRPRHEREVQDGFQKFAINRIPDYLNKAKKQSEPPKWMSTDFVKDWMDWRSTEDFKKKSDKKKLNRASGSSAEEGGKIPGTHAMGRSGFGGLARCSDGSELSVVDLVTRSKKKKTGGFVSKKIEQIIDVFTTKKAKAQETQPDTPIDETRLYYEAAGGYDKKGRVYGMGSAASMFYDRPSASARHSSAETYRPGLLTQLSQDNARLHEENAATKAKLAEQEERIRRMEMLFAQQFPPTCNPNDPTQPRDGRPDDHGPGGGDVGMGSTPFLTGF